MNNLKKTKEAFSAGSISKAEFITQMHECHKQLFDYVDELHNCNLCGISITRVEVVAEFTDPNIKMICPRSDNRIAPIEAFNFGAFEFKEIRAVSKIVDLLGGRATKIFDVGANAGFYSLALARYFNGITGVAFEPVPLTYSYLKRNFEINEVRGINALNIGLSDAPGQLSFAVAEDHSGASFIATKADEINSQLVKCDVTTIDDFVAQSGIFPDFIKCDVEGAELLVFKGARNLLTNKKPVVFTEMLRKWAKKFDYHPNDIIRYFSDLGYLCFVIRDEKLMSFNCVEDDTLDTNYIFLHSENHSSIISNFS